MSYSFRPALKTSPKLLVGIYSESGCGKTFSALLLAKGFAGDMAKVGMIETESGRGELYADHKTVGGYNVLSMRDSFSPTDYGKAIDVANHENLNVLIIDSASHEWEGVNGVLSMAADNEAAGKKGQLVWQRPKIAHAREFMLRLTQTPIPLVIVCMRAKYPMEQVMINGRKDWQRSKTLSPKQSEDILFEMLVHGWADYDHNFHITKPRGAEDELGILAVFQDGKPITVDSGKRLSDWAKGSKPATTPTKPKPAVPATPDQLKRIAAMLNARGAVDKLEMLKELTDFFQRPIASSHDLTASEADDFIATEFANEQGQKGAE